MNGTIIEIDGIIVDVATIDLQDSTDKAHTITIRDNEQGVKIEVAFGKITNIAQWKK